LCMSRIGESGDNIGIFVGETHFSGDTSFHGEESSQRLVAAILLSSLLGETFKGDNCCLPGDADIEDPPV